MTEKLSNLGAVLFLLAALALSACSSSQKMARPDNTGQHSEGFDGMDEDFNPAELDDYDLDIEDPVRAGHSDSDNMEKQVAAPQDTLGTGYRVQVIQTTDPEEAKEVEREALLRFDHDVYRVFDPPFYKVRVGDFVNWRDAEKLQDLAIKKGFRDAWVIRTTINLTKAYDALGRL